MLRRFPEDRPTITEIRKHPWLSLPDETPASISHCLTNRLEHPAQIFRAQALRRAKQGSPITHPIPPPPPEHLKKLMLEYRQKTRQGRIDCRLKGYKQPILMPQKSSSHSHDSSGQETDETPRPPKISKVAPSSPKRPPPKEDQWSSSDSEHFTK